MAKIDKAEYEKRIEKITGILAGMLGHAESQSRSRCPYRNRLDQCTAKFGCRNQRKPLVKNDPLLCGDGGKIDYRTAWETDPDKVEDARRELKSLRADRESRMSGTKGNVSAGGRNCPAMKGRTLFHHADVLGIKVPTSCGRSGICHECVVEVTEGLDSLCNRTVAEDFLSGSYRLSCQAVVEDADRNVEFSLLTRSPKILTSGERKDIPLNPVVTHRDGRVYYDGEDIDRFRGHLYGLALDVGTTTVVGDLVDLESGESMYLISFENPQRFGGSDVMHRISYDGGVFEGELHNALINTLNEEIRIMCEAIQISRHEIYELVVVGNATMRDLFLNLNVQTIGQMPYKSQSELDMLEGRRSGTAVTQLSRKLRLRANKNARVYAGPLVASHVGADVSADLLAMEMHRQDDVVMLVDVGTNTEVVIGTKNRLIAASCPAGPAFEGGLVTHGMMGVDGAIESIRMEAGEWACRTIGNVEPVGFCGSGLIELLAELCRNDLCTPMGVFANKAREFAIVPGRGITFSRADASHLAQAKAANFCGQIILMRAYGIRPDQISRLYLAGGFANYVDVESAVEIGFLAPVPPERVVKIGNAALEGAREMLVSNEQRRIIESLVQTIEHVELETTGDFFEVFAEGCQLKPMPAGDW